MSDGSLYEDEAYFAAIAAEYDARSGAEQAGDEGKLLDLAQRRELRTLRARHAARLAFDEEQAACTDLERAEPLNWADFLARNLSDVDWCAGKVMAKGQQISVVGDGKVGKSLLMLDWSCRMAAGLPFLGDQAREPVRVLYVDQENSHDVLQSRIHSLGMTIDELENLLYLSFPAFRPLNTAGGGADLMRSVERHQAQVVVLDTISRMVEGKENDSDPWLDLYRYTLLPMKRDGVGSARLDHFGKDVTWGSRGSSAKNQDVDHVWELHGDEDDNLLTLKRTHTRTGIGPGFFNLVRLGEKVGDQWAFGRTRHELAAHESDHGPGRPKGWVVAEKVAAQLDELGVPTSWGRQKIRTVHGAALKVGNGVLDEAIAIRRKAERMAA